ncbi:MAG: carboxypeptidase regulatory-like domain-containing protein [Nitrospirae bacterium]|nr:carboxypeptidase regulatory-like domain-containing protein [Nitrospirota bacterium]
MRQSKGIILAVAFLALFMVTALAIGQEKTFSIKGKVKDKRGYPISGINVVISGAEIKKSAVTDSKGEFVFKGLVSGRYIVQASKRGYTFDQIMLNLKEDVTMDIKAVTSPKEK